HTRSKRDWSSDVCSSDLPISKPKSWILGRSSRAKKRLTLRLRLWGKNKQAPMNRKSPLYDRAYDVQPQMKLPYSRHVIMQDLGKKRPKYRLLKLQNLRKTCQRFLPALNS